MLSSPWKWAAKPCGSTQKAGLLDSLSVSGISTAAGSFTAAAEGSADLGWSGVGQYEDLANPCALMTLCGTIANRGTQVPPRLLLKETTAAGLRTGHSRAEKHSGTLIGHLRPAGLHDAPQCD